LAKTMRSCHVVFYWIQSGTKVTRYNLRIFSKCS